MSIKGIPLEIIDDNPFNPRKHYSQTKVKEMAASLLENGLLQVPEGREVDGRVQLAFGHMRKRGYASNLKHEPDGGWGSMPVNIKELSDQDMFDYSLEENLRRTDITPLETARCIENFSLLFPDILDEEVAKRHGMTAANVSNMKRVLRLPEKILEKIDVGTISFTQGRELLIFEAFENGENLMKTAIDGLKIGTKYYGEPNTVEGLQKSTHTTVSGHCRPLDKEWQGYYWDILFDTRATGCLQCEKMVKTHPTKSQVAHFCTDEQCWDSHQQEQHDKAAADAKARMEAEIARRAAEVHISQEKSTAPTYTIKQSGISWVASDAQGRVIAADTNRANAEVMAMASFEPVVTILNPHGDQYLLNHTYRIIHKNHLENVPDVTAQDLATAIKAVGVTPENVEFVKVWKSTGKPGTSGAVAGGWGKCSEPLADEHYAEQLEPPDETCATYEELREMEASETAKVEESRLEISREKANLERPVGDLPCDTCARKETCDRTHFHVADDDSGRLVCDIWECDHVSWALPEEKKELIPEETLAKAREAAGTRAEALDIHPLFRDQWSQELRGGHVLLNHVFREMDDPEECTERCVKGFHYAFDSGHLDRTGLSVCTDPKCVSKKKAALTRKRNAEGQARKKAEVRAVKKAVNDTFSITRSHIKVILLAQIEGSHVERTYYGGEQIKRPSKWLWDKVSAGTKDVDRTNDKLFKAIDNLTNEDLASLVMDMMFYYLVDHGDVGTYKIKTEVPLGWLGAKIELEEESS